MMSVPFDERGLLSVVRFAKDSIASFLRSSPIQQTVADQHQVLRESSAML